MVAILTRTEAIKAHAIQFGLLYVYGLSFEEKDIGKKKQGVRNFFQFVTEYFWKIKQSEVKGNGRVMKKRNAPKVMKLWKDINSEVLYLILNIYLLSKALKEGTM